MTATARIGSYNCLGPAAQHTYASADSQWYDCFGGHEKDGKTVQSYFWEKTAYFSPLKPTRKTEVPINKDWADGIASWGSLATSDIQKSHAGIIYLVTGVCHQACNRVLFAATNDDWGYINWTPSFEQSYGLYGYYGGGAKGVFDKLRMKELYNFKKTYRTDFQLDSLSSTNNILQEHLDSKPTKEQLREVIAFQFGVEQDDIRIEKVIEEQQEIYNRKYEFDRDLLSGNISSKKECTQIIDVLGRELLLTTINVFGTSSKGYNLDSSSEGANETFVSEDLMPDLGYYKELGNNVKY
jgi:hypothetical protein